jgi:hypothetical protein
MNGDVQPPGAPENRSKRPIDATGLFWAFVMTAYALFSIGICGLVYGATYGVPLLIGALFCLRWQFTKWAEDSAHNRSVRESFDRSENRG